MAKRLALLIPPIRSVYEQRNRLLSHVTALEARVAELEGPKGALKSTIVESEARGVASRTEINALVGLAAEGQSLEQFNAKYGDVQGYMLPGDMATFDFLMNWQNKVGTAGDYFEIGVFMGKSTFFSSQFIKPSERIGLVDIITLDHVVGPLRKQGFNIQAYEGKSSGIRYSELYKSFAGKVRLFHIDGDHSGSTTYSDLLLAADAICQGGIIAVDDFYNRNYPQLAAATYKFLYERIDFKMLLVGANKGYIVRAEDYNRYYEAITRFIQPTMRAFGQSVTLRKTSYAHDMGCLVLAPREREMDIMGCDEDVDHIPY
jgi:hypothetical protein